MASLDLYAPHIYVPPAVKWYVRTSELGTGSDTKFGKFAEERLIRDIKMVLLHIDYPCRTDNLYGPLCLDYPKTLQIIQITYAGLCAPGRLNRGSPVMVKTSSL